MRDIRLNQKVEKKGDLCFVYPSYQAFSAGRVVSSSWEYNWVQHGIAELASYLRRWFKVAIVDMRHCQDWDHFIDVTQGYDYVGFGVNSSDFNMAKAAIRTIKEFNPKSKIIVGGIHATTNPEDFPEADFIVKHEAEGAMKYILDNNILESTERIIDGNDHRLENLDEVPYINRLEWDCEKSGAMRMKLPFYTIMSSRECVYNCLSGDTMINTIKGKIPLKELTKRETIPVYTYDRKKQEVVIAEAKNIKLLRKDAKVIKVHFNDGTHIICTPDHEILTFKQANQFKGLRETIKLAKDLEINDSIRAIKRYEVGGYIDIAWGRDKRNKEHRLIAEFMLGRKLRDKEQIHHKNRIKNDNRWENLEVVRDAKEQFSKHPEIAKRMKRDNPVKYLTREARQRGIEKLKGKTRSYEQRLRYRESKLGDKNPNYRGGVTAGLRSRIPEINHKVIKIEELTETQDVYCLEVPGYDWFFANDILVHNCSFCSARRMFGKTLRARSIDYMIGELKYFRDHDGLGSFHINDDNFLQSIPYVKEFIMKFRTAFPGEKIEFSCQGRVDNIIAHEKMGTMKQLVDLGLKWVLVGFESGSQKVLDIYNKQIKAEQNYEGARILKKYGIKIFANFMFGAPGETNEDMKKTYELIKYIKPEILSAAACTPYPGTPLWNFCKNQGILIDPHDTRNYYDRGGVRLPKIKGVDYPDVEAWMQISYAAARGQI